MFATDSEADLRNTPRRRRAPGFMCVALTEGTHTADWPLSRKFGCQTDMALDLMILARDLGLEPYGVSFQGLVVISAPGTRPSARSRSCSNACARKWASS